MVVLIFIRSSWFYQPVILSGFGGHFACHGGFGTLVSGRNRVIGTRAADHGGHLANEIDDILKLDRCAAQGISSVGQKGDRVLIARLFEGFHAQGHRLGPERPQSLRVVINACGPVAKLGLAPEHRRKVETEGAANHPSISKGKPLARRAVPALYQAGIDQSPDAAPDCPFIKPVRPLRQDVVGRKDDCHPRGNLPRFPRQKADQCLKRYKIVRRQPKLLSQGPDRVDNLVRVVDGHRRLFRRGGSCCNGLSHGNFGRKSAPVHRERC